MARQGAIVNMFTAHGLQQNVSKNECGIKMDKTWSKEGQQSPRKEKNMVEKNEKILIGNEVKGESETEVGRASRVARDWAQKYRPKTFDDLWQKEVPGITLLKKGIEVSRVPQAIICAGTYGVGKTSLARVFGRRFTCLNPSAHPYNPCGTCSSCREFRPGHYGSFVHKSGYIEFDVTERSVNALMDDLSRRMSLKWIEKIGTVCEHHPWVMCLDEISQLSKPDLQKRLIKIMEDEPAARFFLCVTDPGDVIDAVAERAVNVLLPPPTTEEAIAGMTRIAHAEGVDADDRVLRHIAASVKNVPRRCIQALESACTLSDGKTITLDAAMTAVSLVAK